MGQRADFERWGRNVSEDGRDLAPTRLWQHLGERRGHPFVPFRAQLDIFNRIHIPYPGYVLPNGAFVPVAEGEKRPDAKPYPNIFPLNCGRRFSKTTVLEKLVWKGMLADEDFFGPPVVRVTADTEEHGRKVWDRFIRHLTTTPLQALLDVYSKERELVLFKNGANAQLISSNNPSALAGDGVTLWIVDEAQYMTKEAWENLFPSVSERWGIIVLAGVCEGEGPYKTLSLWGNDPQKPQFHTMSYPTEANPYVPRAFLEFARSVYSPSRYAELYLARWEGGTGKLFRNVRANLNGKVIRESPHGYFYTEEPKPGREYVAGLDLGRLQDWTVHSVWRPNGELVAWDRYALVDWEVQKQRARQLDRIYKVGSTAVDAAGLGDVVAQNLQNTGMRVVDTPINTLMKRNTTIDRLAIRVGDGSVSYPEINEFLDEMSVMEAVRSPSGNTIYRAPAGMHDDWVISGSLAMSLLPDVSIPPPSEEDRAAMERQRGVWED